MFSYLTNLILFLLLATVAKSQTNATTSTTSTSSTSTTTVAPVTTTTGSTTIASSTTASTTRSNITNGSVTTITLIRNNATSNYLLWPFASLYENFTLPFAIDQCSLFNINEKYYLKPTCVSNTLVNVTFYNDSGCATNPYRYEAINNISVFRCNESNNYAELYMDSNSSCANSATTYVGINYCFPTVLGYASFFCAGKKVQYASFNSSSCVNNGLLTVSQVNSTLCGPFISNGTYVTLSNCVNNATTSPSTTSGSTSTSTSSTSSTTRASTTSTTRGVTTSSTSGTSTSTTTASTTRTSSGTSIFVFNNVVFILSIIAIFNIIS